MKDLMGLMKQAQAMQSKMADMQAELEMAQVVGQSGGGLVSITLTGKGQMVSIKIDPSLMAPGEGDIVEDLIVAAHADARGKSERMMADKMGALTSGLPLPPGFKLPF